MTKKTMTNRSVTGLALLGAVIFSSSLGVAESPQAAPPEPDSMVRIFNGKDLTGWDGDERLWSVVDGVIRGETTADLRANKNTFLVWTGGKTEDFELRLSFRCNAANNSGIQYRSERFESGNRWRLRGYQHEIRNQEKLPHVSGFIYDEAGKRGRICLAGQRATWGADGKKVADNNLITAEEFVELMRIDDWNDVVIIASGNHIRHYLNGRLILDFTDNHPEWARTTGTLGLQLHAGAPMWAEFKDVRIRHLTAASK